MTKQVDQHASVTDFVKMALILDNKQRKARYPSETLIERFRDLGCLADALDALQQTSSLILKRSRLE